MKKSLILLLLFSNSFAVSCASRLSDEKWIAAMPKPWQLSEKQLDQELPKFTERFPDFQQRLRALAIWRVGTPYEIFKLGEEQAPDNDPIFRLDVSDCTVHVLTSLSLAQSSSWNEARQKMIEIHYKTDAAGKKTPTYSSRWHFTADRIMHHPSTPSISTQLLSVDQLTNQQITFNQKQDGSEFLKLGWSLAAAVKYIPNDKITTELISQLPAIVGVAFVKPANFKLGIITAHEGMIIDGIDLLHAGQIAGVTARENFMDYYFTDEGPRFGGIMLYEFLPLE